MANTVKLGTVNMPKLLRNLDSRTNQVRDLVFARDPIYRKSTKATGATSDTKGDGTALSGPAVNFGYEQSSFATQCPITSRSGTLDRIGHRINGACTFYLPPLDYIRALDNFSETTQFDELETYDKLLDMERIIQNPSNVTSTGQQTIDLSPGSTYPAGYEIDRIQFKIKTDTTSGGDLVYFKLTGIDTTEKHITWTATDTFSPTDWVTVDLPLRDVNTDDTKEVYIGGAAKTFTATSTLDIDKLYGGDSSSYLSSLIIDISGSATVELKDIYLYKEAEWRVETIKDYRDEYMEIGAVRVRGDRTSRRRAYG
jgi:hypothetical protein